MQPKPFLNTMRRFYWGHSVTSQVQGRIQDLGLEGAKSSAEGARI